MLGENELLMDMNSSLLKELPNEMEEDENLFCHPPHKPGGSYHFKVGTISWSMESTCIKTFYLTLVLFLLQKHVHFEG